MRERYAVETEKQDNVEPTPEDGKYCRTSRNRIYMIYLL